jgi:hypothetical protein
MMNCLQTTNYKSSYLNSLANDFDKKIQSREGFVLPKIKGNNLANDGPQKQDKKTNWGYLSGVAATIGQVVGGLLMIPAAFLERGGNKLTESKIELLPKNLSEKETTKEIAKIIEDFGNKSSIERLGNWLNKKGKYREFAEKISKNGKNLHRLGTKFNRIGWVSLGFSYLVSIPSLLGASLTIKQPSMLLGTVAWAVASPFMMMKKYEDSTKLKGFLMLGYALNYLGLANKIKNDSNKNKDEKALEFDFKGNDNLLSKTFKTFKISLKDHLSISESVKNAFKQTKEYISGKRKEAPDFLSANPTSDNRKITSLLLYAGGIPLMIFGNKNGAVKKAANLMIGTGLLLDALGMFAIGRKEKGATKAVLLGGVPLRAVGDFAQTNKFMYGLRTLGGASFEYYFAALNKNEEAKKA